MRLERLRLGAVLFALVVALVVIGPPLRRCWRAAEFLNALARAPEQASKSAAPAERPPVLEHELTIASPRGVIRARLYLPTEKANGRGIVVAHGVHHRGIDERRLVPFARELSRTGLAVLTPELSELADYRITPQGVSILRDSVRYLSQRSDLLREPRIGLLGFSFAGGLALVAAAESETRKRVAFVTSVGGHHDLSRVLRFLIRHRVETPQGVRSLRAHDYGLLVLLYGNLERFVPAVDLPTMTRALRAWLHEDRAQARAFASQRTTFAAERLWSLIEAENLRELGRDLESLLEAQRTELAALSPRGRLASIGAPVYLLHGAEDTVIPPSEVDWAELELGSREHEALVSPLLDHVQVQGKADLNDRIALTRFMAQIL